MKISMIVAYGNEYQIGLDNKLLWSIPADLQNFKRLTSGHHILMGRKTFESIGRPLPNRISLVITSNKLSMPKLPHVHYFSNIEEAFGFAYSQREPELFVIGGAQIYNQCMKFIDRIYVSEVDYDGEADAYLTPIEYDDFQLVEEDYHISTETSPAWRYKVLERLSKSN